MRTSHVLPVFLKRITGSSYIRINVVRLVTSLAYPASCFVGDDLGAAGKANFCEMTLEQQLKLIEAHEGFPH